LTWRFEPGFVGGHSVYIGFVHMPETFNESLMRMLLLSSVLWVARSAP
jgi:type 1 glutamine amidotransferase